MKELIKPGVTSRPAREKYKMNLASLKYNQLIFVGKNLRAFGREIWNSLPFHIKSAENSNSLKSNEELGWVHLSM